MMLAKIEVNLNVFWQPQHRAFPCKRHEAVFHDLMFTEHLNFVHGVDHVSLNMHDLRSVGRDPCSPLQVDAINLASKIVVLHAIWTVGTLAEVY